MKRMSLFLWFLLPFSLFASGRTVSGYVVDTHTGETIIGVNVVAQGTVKGAATDKQGYFVISSLKPGTWTLEFTHIAYEKKSVTVDLTEKSRVLSEIALKPRVVETPSVSIVGQKSELADLSLETAHRVMSVQALRQIPGAAGDVFRAIKSFPGVEAAEPFSPLYTVRGGDTGENLVLLDGVPIYNPYHFVGSSGLFNVYAIKDIEMMVGGFGVEYGGRNASILSITTREGNNRRLHGEFSPGTTESQAAIDFPIGNKGTMMVSGRFYHDLLSRFLLDMPSWFYDGHLNLTWRLGSRHRLTLRGFVSQDKIRFHSETYFDYLGTTFHTDVFEDYDFRFLSLWKNRAFSAELKSLLGPGCYLHNRVYGSFFRARDYSLYDFQYETEEKIRLKYFMETDIRSAISDIGWKCVIHFEPRAGHALKAGWEGNRYAFDNDLLLNGLSEGRVIRRPVPWAVFLEDRLSVGPLVIRPGVRLTRFGERSRWRPETRLNLSVVFSERLTLKAARGRYHQSIISLNTQEYAMSQFLDNYVPLTHAPPAASDQTILGVDWRIRSGLSLVLDLYHKALLRTYAYDYGVSQSEALRLSDKIRAGTGEAYGAEALIQGDVGRLSGWIGYGIGRSTRSYPHILNGKSHLFDYDRTHALKVVLHYRIPPRVEFSGMLQILSGIPKTLEAATGFYYYYDAPTNRVWTYPIPITPEKNNIRLPMHLRLDLGLKKRLRKGFGADLAKYLGAEEASLSLHFGNLLFLFQRNVWFYVWNEGTLYGVGTNYLPEWGASYWIRF